MAKSKKSATPFQLSRFTYILIGAVLIIGFFLGAQYKKSNKVTPNKSKLVNNEYVTYETPSPAPTTKEIIKEQNETQSVQLLSTEGWKEVSFENLTFKIPSQASGSIHNYPETCQDNFNLCYTIKNHDPNDQFQGIEIAVKPYGGGSRRAEASWEGTYKYRDITIGKYNALEATFVCQVDGCTPMRRVLIVVGGTLVSIQDSMYLDKRSGGEGTESNPWNVSYESPVTNTIVSTIK